MKAKEEDKKIVETVAPFKEIIDEVKGNGGDAVKICVMSPIQ